MQDFIFQLPTKIVFGKDSFLDIAKHLRGFGKKAFIIIGQGSVEKNGYLASLEKNLQKISVDYFIFSGIEANPSDQTIDKAAEIIREYKPKFVIALGGGSVMDASKCIAMLAVNDGKIWDYAYKGITEKMQRFNKALPLVCIPTLSATGSEADRYAVVSNYQKQEKCTVFGDALFPRLTIIDPVLKTTVPKRQTIDGCIDIIAHVLEDYLSSNENTKLQDRFSLAIVKTVMDFLPPLLKDLSNIEARSQIAWASTIALSGFLAGRDGQWPLHAIEHAISAIDPKISHGSGLASIITAVLEFDLPHNTEKIAYLGEYLFDLKSKKDIQEKARDSIFAFKAWLNSLGIDYSLKSLGIKDFMLPLIAKKAIKLNGNIYNQLSNIANISENELLNILEKSF